MNTTSENHGNTKWRKNDPENYDFRNETFQDNCEHNVNETVFTRGKRYPNYKEQ